MRRLIYQLRQWWARRHAVKCDVCGGTGFEVYTGPFDPIFADVCCCCGGEGWHVPL